jgi:hypothetical protein
MSHNLRGFGLIVGQRPDIGPHILGMGGGGVRFVLVTYFLKYLVPELFVPFCTIIKRG